MTPENTRVDPESRIDGRRWRSASSSSDFSGLLGEDTQPSEPEKRECAWKIRADVKRAADWQLLCSWPRRISYPRANSIA